MNIRPIHTEEDYRAALKSVSALFDNCLLYTSDAADE